jgi:small-conductance mechanosensitive channel
MPARSSTAGSRSRPRPTRAAGRGEGGPGRSRLATLLPLVRNALQLLVVFVAGLVLLHEAGVNTTPIFASAGIVGLAIGFGAQSLVKDIISGLFFLLDDAFRVGEYIEVGGIKGSVERISIRSMQLRHHNGPLNTIAFGSISELTNYSRDWVIMKLPILVTLDTDVERARKLVKKLGVELLEDPQVGNKFLEPLKSQGVPSIHNWGMTIRVKFKTRPGDQFAARRVVYTKLHEMFEREGSSSRAATSRSRSIRRVPAPRRTTMPSPLRPRRWTRPPRQGRLRNGADRLRRGRRRGPNRRPTGSRWRPIPWRPTLASAEFGKTVRTAAVRTMGQARRNRGALLTRRRTCRTAGSSLGTRNEGRPRPPSVGGQLIKVTGAIQRPLKSTLSGSPLTLVTKAATSESASPLVSPVSEFTTCTLRSSRPPGSRRAPARS